MLRFAPSAMANGESARSARRPADHGRRRTRRRTRASSRSAASQTRPAGSTASTRRYRSRRRRSSRMAPSTPPRSRSIQRPTLHEHMRKMAPELQELLVELPPVLIAALGSEGIETAADLVGLYPNVDAFLDVLREVTGHTVRAEMNMDTARVYSRLVAQAREARRIAVQTVVAARESVYPSVPASQLASAPASSARARPLVGLGTGQAGVHTTSSPAPLAAQAEEAAKQVKLDALFGILLEYVLNIAELGITQASLDDPLQRQEVRDTILHGAARLSTARLGHLVSSFRRWLRFCAERSWDPRSPKPFQLASFLHSVSRGGQLQRRLCMRL